jgi:hypothetical protein
MPKLGGGGIRGCVAMPLIVGLPVGVIIKKLIVPGPHPAGFQLSTVPDKVTLNGLLNSPETPVNEI